MQAPVPVVVYDPDGRELESSTASGEEVVFDIATGQRYRIEPADE